MRNQIFGADMTSKGSAHIDEWMRLLTAVVARPTFEYDEGRQSTKCAVIVPTRGRVEAEGESVEVATANLMSKIQSVLGNASSNGHWPLEWHQLASTVQIVRSEQSPDGTSLQLHSASSESRMTTKQRQETIGVSCKRSLQTFIAGCASSSGESAAQVARLLLSDGFEDFEERTITHSANRVFAVFQKDYDQLASSETTQWMVRTSPSLFVRIRLTAKEHGKSASQLSAMCMAHALVKRQVTELELEKAQTQVMAVQGPKVRKLAAEIGLGKNTALINGVLAGRVAAPSQVLQLLSDRFQVAALALAESFRRSFSANTVPAFKAEDGKPFVQSEPQSWSVAVHSLKLTDSETEKLMQFAD